MQFLSLNLLASIWDSTKKTQEALPITFLTWWCIGWVDSFQPSSSAFSHGFDSRSSRHVGTLGKSLTHNYGVKFRHSRATRALSGALLSRSGLEEAL